ncbi:hypothetical protein KYC5002_13690 [Archangium violaceum]|uniref:hypothetical protein n=1 Tax=Archangium TaxID=47 RepID=UPI0009361767|nr:hypothetical protein [Archangium sp. Cb G35]OJT23176.1 hypothetical protein BO221_20095 [Archangium sp. Cb G35]WNG59821.1 hypothetical protein F0U59_37715 [Archangium gephyra]WPB80182.1 hypothetical protein KYC5002_13690 [Archangium gephyra]
MANRISRITAFVEKRKLGFGVARLIMMSGVNVRSIGPNDPDPPDALRRLEQALPQLLSAQELSELQQLLSEA